MTDSAAQPSSVRAVASGRVNLMGDHTDYNEGFVLPMPIPLQTSVTLVPTAGDHVLVESHGATPTSVRFELGREQRQHDWVDYIQGVTHVLRMHGHAITGFTAHIESTVPPGAGLASSAALTVSALRALREAYRLTLSDRRLAQLAQAVEVEFVGAPVGIMDPLIASLGAPDQALLIDTRSLATRPIPLPSELALIVIDSGVSHAHAAGGYRARRSECEQAATLLGLRSLRDYTPGVGVLLETLEGVLQRRARHVLSENERVHATAAALRQEDGAALRALFAESHASLRDDFEVSVPEIDHLVELAAASPSVIAARMTGGGFGGSVVMLAQRDRVHAAAGAIAERFASRFGRAATILLPEPASGA